jgi:hypothetical protein
MTLLHHYFQRFDVHVHLTLTITRTTGINFFIEEKRKAAVDDRPIAAVITSAVEEDLIQPRDRKRLADFTENDFFNYFSSTDSPRLTLQLKKLVLGTSTRGGGDEYDKAINPILWKVAQRLARSGNSLNHHRIEAMGLLKPGPTHSEAAP